MIDQLSLPAQTRRRKRSFLVGACIILLGMAAFWWWFFLKPILPFMGTWRIEQPAPTVANLVNEVEFTFSGTVIQRVRDSTTNTILVEEESADMRWRVSEGRFQQFAKSSFLPRWMSGVRDRPMFWDHALTWERPDRIRLENPSHSAPVIILARHPATQP